MQQVWLLQACSRSIWESYKTSQQTRPQFKVTKTWNIWNCLGEQSWCLGQKLGHIVTYCNMLKLLNSSSDTSAHRLLQHTRDHLDSKRQSPSKRCYRISVHSFCQPLCRQHRQHALNIQWTFGEGQWNIMKPRAGICPDCSRGEEHDGALCKRGRRRFRVEDPDNVSNGVWGAAFKENVGKPFAPVSAIEAHVTSNCETMRHFHREQCWFLPATAPSWPRV